ncbi:MAG: hypothetical protein ACK4UQ_06510 [Brevundimonas sp.]
MAPTILLMIAGLLAFIAAQNTYCTIRADRRLAEMRAFEAGFDERLREVRAREAAYDQQHLDTEYRSNLEGSE